MQNTTDYSKFVTINSNLFGIFNRIHSYQVVQKHYKYKIKDTAISLVAVCRIFGQYM